jgi:hypothetical protein
MTAQWVMYGIKNCDTIKKARNYLAESGTDYRFHDYRVDGIDDALLQSFIDQLGYECYSIRAVPPGVICQKRSVQPSPMRPARKP